MQHPPAPAGLVPTDRRIYHYQTIIVMPALSPIYTLKNCHTAFQLNWSLSIFWHQQASDAEWLTALQAATEPDGVRILGHRFVDERMSQFLVSTKPAVSPHDLVRSVKGRLQYLVRRERPKAFQRNYSLRSVGSATRADVENYVRTQPGHHPWPIPRCRRGQKSNDRCCLREARLSSFSRGPCVGSRPLDVGRRTESVAWRYCRLLYEQPGLSRRDEMGFRVRILRGDVWRV